MRHFAIVPCLGLGLICFAVFGWTLDAPTPEPRPEGASQPWNASVHPPVYGIAWSPTGTELVAMHDSTMAGPANLVQHDLRGPSPQASGLPVRGASAVAWLQDELLVGGHDGQFWANAQRDDRVAWQFHGKLRVRQIAAANGRTAIFTEDNRLWLGDKGNPTQVHLEWPFGITSLHLSPDGSLLLASGNSHRVVLLNGHSGKILREWDAQADQVVSAFANRSASEATDEERQTTPNVVFANQTGLLTVADSATGTILQERLLNSHKDGIACLAVSPDGRTVALGSYGRTVALWDLWSLRPGVLKEGHSGCVCCLEFSPDGRSLASGGADGGVCIWDVGTNALVHRLWRE